MATTIFPVSVSRGTRLLTRPSRQQIIRPVLCRLSAAANDVSSGQRQQRQPLSHTAAAAKMATVSSSETPNKEFMFLIPDFPNNVEGRLAVRSKHLENVQPLVAERKVVFGAATISDAGQMSGSFILVRAETEEEARKVITGDIYASSKVWDVENLKVWEIKSAFRIPVD